MVDQAIDNVLGQRERVVVDAFFANGAIDQMLRRLLHEIEDDGSFAEADVLIADSRGSPAPGIPAAKRPAHNTRITAIGDGNRSVTALDGEMVSDQEIGG